jgi:hypothetical protein
MFVDARTLPKSALQPRYIGTVIIFYQPTTKVMLNSGYRAIIIITTIIAFIVGHHWFWLCHWQEWVWGGYQSEGTGIDPLWCHWRFFSRGIR